jgi:hypothetical protein
MALKAPRDEPRLRVLHLRSSAGLYGAEQVLLTLLPALPALGIEVVLGCLRNPYQPRLELHERALALGIDSRLVACDGRFDSGTVGAIRRLAEDLDADAVHVHDYKSVFHARLANRPRRPLVATLHGHFADTGWCGRRIAGHTQACGRIGAEAVLTNEAARSAVGPHNAVSAASLVAETRQRRDHRDGALAGGGRRCIAAHAAAAVHRHTGAVDAVVGPGEKPLLHVWMIRGGEEYDVGRAAEVEVAHDAAELRAVEPDAGVPLQREWPNGAREGENMARPQTHVPLWRTTDVQEPQ